MELSFHHHTDYECLSTEFRVHAARLIFGCFDGLFKCFFLHLDRSGLLKLCRFVGDHFFCARSTVQGPQQAEILGVASLGQIVQVSRGRRLVQRALRCILVRAWVRLESTYWRVSAYGLAALERESSVEGVRRGIRA